MCVCVCVCVKQYDEWHCCAVCHHTHCVRSSGYLQWALNSFTITFATDCKMCGWLLRLRPDFQYKDVENLIAQWDKCLNKKGNMLKSTTICASITVLIQLKIFSQKLCYLTLCQYSVWLKTGRLRFSPQQRRRIFLQPLVSGPALKPIQSPTQWVLGIISGG
jgi:hypothetical protein